MTVTVAVIAGGFLLADTALVWLLSRQNRAGRGATDELVRSVAGRVDALAQRLELHIDLHRLESRRRDHR